MLNRTKLISGVLSLSEIEREIRFEEAKSFEFLTSSVENNKNNLADFKRLEIGNIPKNLKLTRSVSPVPEGYAPFPNSPIAMIVDGSTNPVKLWVWRLL